MRPERPTLDLTFMTLAQVWANRGTCDRAQVGAVLARDGRSISSAYNGAPPGMRHCKHDGIVDDAHNCVRANHAERNVIAFAARHGVRTEGATLYVTHSPCSSCGLELLAAGIVRVVFAIPYRIDDPGYSGVPVLGEAGVKLDRLSL